MTPKQAAFVREYCVDEARFWAYVSKDGGESGCWLWIGARDSHGYGCFHIGKSKNSMIRAHRAAFALVNGDLPNVVRHTCDNPPCCNPAHLLPGTRAENNRDMMERGRHWSQTGSFKPRSGLAHDKTKITQEKAQRILARHERGGITQRQLAGEFGLSQRSIAKVIHGIWWGAQK